MTAQNRRLYVVVVVVIVSWGAGRGVKGGVGLRCLSKLNLYI